MTRLGSLIGEDSAKAYFQRVAQIESGGKAGAENPASSASGLYQFIKSTWVGLGYDWKDRFSVTLQNEAIDKFTFANANELIKGGCAINFATLYGAHFLGAHALLTVMRAKPSTMIAAVVAPAQAKANPTILGGTKTVKDFCAWLENRTGQKYTSQLASVSTAANAAPIVVEPQKGKDTSVPMNWLNPFVVKTALQYLLAMAGGYLTGKGLIDASSWQEISGGLLLAIPALFGIKNAATEKVMIGGTVAKVADLTPATQNAVAREIGAK